MMSGPEVSMKFSRLSCCAALCASFVLTLLLTGCADMGTTPISAANPTVTGNWQFSSASANAAKLASFSGELTGNASQMTGILHSNSTTSCVAPSVAIAMTGSTNANGVTTLTSSNFPSGTLTITGTLAADGKSFNTAAYTVTGGTCAFTQPANATAQDYAPISGTFTGGFSDPDGHLINVTATLTQSPTSDVDGNFTLSGNGTFPSNPCFISPVTVSNTQVTGGSFTFTYADPTTTNSVTANGTFSTDGKTLTVTSWTLTGPCGPDTGTGTLTRQ